MSLRIRFAAPLLVALSMLSVTPHADALARGRTPSTARSGQGQQRTGLNRATTARNNRRTPTAGSRSYLPSGIAINGLTESIFVNDVPAAFDARKILSRAATIVKSVFRPGRLSSANAARIIQQDGANFSTTDNGNRLYIIDVAPQNSARRELVRVTAIRDTASGKITITNARYDGFTLRAPHGALPSRDEGTGGGGFWGANAGSL